MKAFCITVLFMDYSINKNKSTKFQHRGVNRFIFYKEARN